MSVVAKTRRIKVSITDRGKTKFYVVPPAAGEAVATLLAGYQEDEGRYISSRELYPELNDPIQRGAIAFKGTRRKQGLTQVEFAAKLSMNQSDISKIEKGEREISRKLAIRIGEIFKTNYKKFL